MIVVFITHTCYAQLKMKLISVDTTKLEYKVKLLSNDLVMDFGSRYQKEIDGRTFDIKVKNKSNYPIIYLRKLTCYADGIFPNINRQYSWRLDTLQPKKFGVISLKIALGRRFGTSHKRGKILFRELGGSNEEEVLNLFFKLIMLKPRSAPARTNMNSMIKH